MELTDIYTELKSGVLLLRLLEQVSGERLPSPSRFNGRIVYIANHNIVLDFLKSKVRKSIIKTVSVSHLNVM